MERMAEIVCTDTPEMSSHDWASRIVFNVLSEICEDGAFLVLLLLQLRQSIFCYVQRIPDGLSKLSRRLLGALKGC